MSTEARRDLVRGLNRAKLLTLPLPTEETLKVVQCYPFDAPAEVVERSEKGGRKMFGEKATREETLSQLALYVALVTNSFAEQAEVFKRARISFDTDGTDTLVAQYASAEFLESSDEDDDAEQETPEPKTSAAEVKSQSAVTPPSKSPSVAMNLMSKLRTHRAESQSDRNRAILEQGGKLPIKTEALSMTHPHRTPMQTPGSVLPTLGTSRMTEQELEMLEVAKLRGFMYFVVYVSTPPIGTRVLAVLRRYSRKELMDRNSLTKAWKAVLKEAVFWNLALQPDPKAFAAKLGAGFPRTPKSQLYNYFVSYDEFISEGKKRYGLTLSDDLLPGHQYSPLLKVVVDENLTVQEKKQLDSDEITTLAKAIPWSHTNIHSSKYGEFYPTTRRAEVAVQPSQNTRFGGSTGERNAPTHAKPSQLATGGAGRPIHHNHERRSSPAQDSLTPQHRSSARNHVTFSSTPTSEPATQQTVGRPPTVSPQQQQPLARRDFNNSKSRWPAPGTSAAQAKPDPPAYNTRSRTAAQKAAYVIHAEDEDEEQPYDEEPDDYEEYTEDNGDEGKHDDVDESGGEADHPTIFITAGTSTASSKPANEKTSGGQASRAEKRKQKRIRQKQSRAATQGTVMTTETSSVQSHHSGQEHAEVGDANATPSQVDLACEWFTPDYELQGPMTITLTSQEMYLTSAKTIQVSDAPLDGHTYGMVTNVGGTPQDAAGNDQSLITVLDNCASTCAVTLSFAKSRKAKQVGTAVLSSITSKDEAHNSDRVVRPIFEMFYVHPVHARTVRFLCVGVPDDALPKARNESRAVLLFGLKMLHLLGCDLNRHLYSGSKAQTPVPPLYFLSFPHQRNSHLQQHPTSTSRPKQTSAPSSLQDLTLVPTANFLVGTPSIDDGSMSSLVSIMSTGLRSFTIDAYEDPHEYLKAVSGEDDPQFGPWSGLPFENLEDGSGEEIAGKSASLHYALGTRYANQVLKAVSERIANEKARQRAVSIKGASARIANEKERLRSVSESCFLSEAKVKFLWEKRELASGKRTPSQPLSMEDRVMAGVSKDLTPQQQRKALYMVRAAIARGVFSDRPGRVNGMEPFRPKLVFPEGKTPRSMPPQRLGEFQQRVVDAFVAECLENGTHYLKDLSDVPFATQVVISCANPMDDKPKLRVNFNEKPTNAFDVQTHTTLPNINRIKEESVGFNYYCSADGTKCFNQRELHPEVAQWYAVHVGRNQVLVPYVMIFGGKSMATECQRMVEDVFSGIPSKHQFVYVDDSGWRAMTFDHLLDIVSQALDQAAARGYTISPDKFRFGHRQIRVLGHIVDAQGMKPSPDLLAEIERTTTAPRNAVEAASTLGLFRYYQRDTPITNFAQLCKTVSSFDTAPLEERERAFHTLRSAILGAPGLAVFDPSLPLVCDSDASDSGGGFFIAHMHGVYTDSRGRTMARKETPITYHSWAWNASQSKWVIYVKECYAFVNCIDHGRWYFSCSQHVPLFRFDQRAILWIRNARSPMVHRWMNSYVYDVDFVLQYREGPTHSNADGVSRWPFKIELISPGNPTGKGVLEAFEVLLNSGLLPRLVDRKQRYLLHAPSVEPLMHQQLKAKGLTERASLVATPSMRILESEWHFGVACPCPEKCITVAHDLLVQSRPVAILMPSDLVGYLPRQSLVDACSKLVFLTDNMVWLIKSPEPTQVRVFTTDVSVKSIELAEPSERLPFADSNTKAVYVLGNDAANLTSTTTLCPPMPFTRQQFKQVSDAWWPGVQEQMTKHMTQLGATLSEDVAGLPSVVMPDSPSARLIVPPTLRSQLTMYYHKLYHHTAASKRAVDIMSRRFYWPNMLPEVEAQIRTCVFCAVAKARVQTASVPYSHLFASAPNEILGIDFVGPLTLSGGKIVRLLTCRDFFGRPGMRIYEEVPDLTAESAFRVLTTRQFWRRGLPRSIFSDRASCFRGKLMTMICEQMGITPMFTSAYSAWQLAVVERDHAMINTFLLSLNPSQADKLALILPQFEALQNDVPNSDGISANSLEYTYVARRPLDVELTPPTNAPPDSEVPVQHLHEWVRLAHEVTSLHRAAVLHEQQEYSQRQQLANANIKRPHVFQVGDRVAVYRVQESPGVSSKMLIHWWFPCRVTSIVASNLYAVVNEITQEITEASGPCLVRFTPSTEDAKVFLQSRSVACNTPWPPASQSGRDPQLPLTSNDLRPGTMVALHASESATPDAFWLGRVQSVDSANNEITVHYYATQSPDLNKATFRLAWSITTPGVDLHKKILSDSKPRSHATAPYTGVEQLSNVISVGLSLTASSKLDAASRDLLRGRTPEPI